MKPIFRFLIVHVKTILQIVIGLLSILAGIYFIEHEQTELAQVRSVLLDANAWLLASGILLVLFFVVVQGWMYQFSFRAVQKEIPLKTAMLLYLKRNFISVFIPAGMVTNMFFFNTDIEEKQGIDRTFIYYASTIFTICSITSSILIAIPAVILLIFKDGLKGDIMIGIGVAVAILGLIVYLAVSIVRKGSVFRFLQNTAPKLAKSLGELRDYPLNRMDLYKVFGFSCVIEVIGVAHLYIAMVALNIPPSLTVAIIGYALVLVILMTSPFLRGIGAIEVSLTYALTLFGYNAVSALSVAFLFRFFEFWSVLVLGIFALLFKKDGLFLQLLAPVLLFFLGVVNILSGLTPALAARVKLLRDFFPYDVLEVSNTTVIVIGVILVATSVALVQGYRNSYYIALLLSIVSFIGHLFKGIDYEEAALALVAMGVLLFQRKDYFIRSAPVKFPKWELALAIFISVLMYGIGGFYLLDFRHFNENFTLWQSVKATVESIALFDVGLNAATPFARNFLLSLNILGISSLLYVVWLAFRAFKSNDTTDAQQWGRAKWMVSDFGISAMDYFKTYPDKQLYFFEDDQGFISYKTTKRYAVVLENPVVRNTSPENLSARIKEFEAFALTQNRNVVYYRVPETSKTLYENLGKKMLTIGEDALVDLKGFSLEGGDAKSLRNAMNKMKNAGFVFKVSPAPQTDGFLQQLAFVSNEWLKDMERSELCFSQGVFSSLELKQQTVLTAENAEGKIVAFLNLIPSIAGELNYDLMRKTADAPNGTMDFLFASMMQHFKQKGYNTINMGMVPLSGIDGPDNLPERAMKLAYEKMKQFGHYKSLHSFKDKFDPVWTKVYVAYDSDLDLIKLTTILNKVMKADTDTI